MRLLTSFLLGLMALGFAHAQNPNWTINANNYSHSMSVIAVGNIACEEVTNSNSQIAAFVGAELRGVVTFSTVASARNYGLLLVYSNINAGEVVHFKIYDETNDVVVNTLDSVVFTNGDIMGNIQDPYVAKTSILTGTIVLSNNIVNENGATNDPIGIVSFLGSNGSYSYSLEPGLFDNDLFTLVNNELQALSSFDFDQTPTLTIEVKATDVNGCTFDQQFTIEIADQNDPPTDIELSNNTIEDESPLESIIGELSTIDPDSGDVHTYTIESGVGGDDNDMFAIDGNNLIVAEFLDFETQELYFVRIRSTDSEGEFVEKSFAITVTDVIEALQVADYISPNGDDVNDYWQIQNVELYSSYSVLIFNEFGQVVFEVPSDYDNSWDASYNGKALPDGIYYYVLSNTLNATQFKGTITVVN